MGLVPAWSASPTASHRVAACSLSEHAASSQLLALSVWHVLLALRAWHALHAADTGWFSIYCFADNRGGIKCTI
jgi:hypothetical protein